MSNQKFYTSFRATDFLKKIRNMNGAVSLSCNWQAINDGGQAIESYTLITEKGRAVFIIQHYAGRESDHGFGIYHQDTTDTQTETIEQLFTIAGMF